MAMPTLAQWKSDTSRWWAKRSSELKSVDDALDTFNKSQSDTDFLTLAAALKSWMQSKNDWSQSTRNTGANADIVSNLVGEVRRHSLVVGFDQVKTNLQKQIQGTCGIYSFYNAVCIFRALHASNTNILPPKKSYHTSRAAHSLREYTKREFLSGQGEVLFSDEMENLVKSQGYIPDAYEHIKKGNDFAAKKQFIEKSLNAGRPVLIAYLADSDKAGIFFTTTIGPGVGAHWSLIIGMDANDAYVVEPNAPAALKKWPLKNFLDSNAASDNQKFVRYWAKAYYPGKPAGIKAVGESKKGWKPVKPVIGKEYGQSKLYDLGGDDTERHLHQDLNNVLVSIQPQFTVLD